MSEQVPPETRGLSKPSRSSYWIDYFCTSMNANQLAGGVLRGVGETRGSPRLVRILLSAQLRSNGASACLHRSPVSASISVCHRWNCSDWLDDLCTRSRRVRIHRSKSTRTGIGARPVHVMSREVIATPCCYDFCHVSAA
jgi:hypothetical protein